MIRTLISAILRTETQSGLRHGLTRLSDHELGDIGLTRHDAFVESRRNSMDDQLTAHRSEPRHVVGCLPRLQLGQ
ncbi:MAG: DUF1127 domain-containing protein [Silicimonas sp.]|nr:DUF1127 domain-containing protein [Silicimonas sp.]